MSFIDMVKTLAQKPKPADPADIEAKLADAQAELERLKTEHSEAAYNAVVSGDTEQAQHVTELSNQIVVVNQQISMLTAAVSVAYERVAQHMREVRVIAGRERLANAERTLTRRQRYATELQDKLAEVARIYRLLLETTDKAAMILPAGATQEANMNVGDVRSAVSHELYRVAAGPFSRAGVDTTRGFPGAHPPTLDFRDQPERITPLATETERANAHALEMMRAYIANGENLTPAELDTASSADTADGVENAEPILEADDGIAAAPTSEAPLSERRDLHTVVAALGTVLDEPQPTEAPAPATPMVHPQPIPEPKRRSFQPLPRRVRH